MSSTILQSPCPEDVTGFAVGSIIYTPAMIADYMRAVAAASDRVSVDSVGRSHFGRQIMRVTITSPENHARLGEIRDAQHEISQASNNDAIPQDHPVIIQFTHGVHGSEPSGYDAIMPLLYFLAAGQGSEVADLLDRSVIHLIGPINPDGADRFASWTNMHRARVPVADPQHREHYNEWPWGRTNHYWFDINRQWLPVTQPEAAALVRATREWMPNIAADFHEMGTNSTYFFSPGPPAGLHPILSQDGLQLNLRMNSFLNEQLDGEGALYVSEEFFDDFYLGYGSSYPGLVGSVPYLFEQSSVRGIIQETDFGTLRYDDKIGQQARVGLALIRAGLANREQLLSFQRDFYREGARLAGAATNLAYVFSSPDSGRLNDFLEMLDVHGIEVHRLSRRVRLDNTDFDPANSYVVNARQREFRVVEALFETRIVEGMTEFYDVSGWTQPLAYGLDFAPVRPGFFAPDLAGERAGAPDRAVPAPPTTGYAYVIDWTNFLRAESRIPLPRSGHPRADGSGFYHCHNGGWRGDCPARFSGDSGAPAGRRPANCPRPCPEGSRGRCDGSCRHHRHQRRRVVSGRVRCEHGAPAGNPAADGTRSGCERRRRALAPVRS